MNQLNEVLRQYDNNRDTAVRPILGFICESRKYGYYVVSGITDKPETEQILWAMRLLLNFSGARLSGDVNSDVFDARCYKPTKDLWRMPSPCRKCASLNETSRHAVHKKLCNRDVR